MRFTSNNETKGMDIIIQARPNVGFVSFPGTCVMGRAGEYGTLWGDKHEGMVVLRVFVISLYNMRENSRIILTIRVKRFRILKN